MTELTTTPDWFERALEQEGESGSIEVDGTTIAYQRWGGSGGPSVVLIHGGAAHSRWWDHIAPLLAEGREVIAFDLSGHGDSGRRSDYSVDVWADEALAVASLAASSHPILIGHSLGGVVALQAAMRAGESLGGIVIVDSPLLHFTPEEDAAADRLAFGPVRLRATREELVARFRPIPDQYAIDYIARHIAEVSVIEVEGGWKWKFDSKIFNRAPQLPALVPLRCRAAFFRGENGMVSDDMAAGIVDGLGGDLVMVKVPDAGHALMLDQPIALVTGLRTILSAWSTSNA